MKLSKRIKKSRIKNGLTQLDLSEKSGVSLRTIQRIENNEVTPSIYSINKISAILNEDFSASKKRHYLRRLMRLFHSELFHYSLAFMILFLKSYPHRLWIIGNKFIKN